MSIFEYVKFAAGSFALPDNCVKVRSAIDDKSASSEDIAKIISIDPSLSAKVLKLANSALFRFPSQIETVAKAVNVIGGEATYNIVMAETAHAAFNTFNSDAIDFNSFWSNSVFCGIAAKSIALQKQVRGSERFFAMGILQNLSQLVVALKSPNQFERACQFNNEISPFRLQKEAFGFTFPVCSGHILEAWKLPLTLYVPLKSLDMTDEMQYSLDEAIIYLSLVMMYAETNKLKLEDLTWINRTAVELVGLSDEEYDMILNYSKVETSKIASIMTG